MTRELGTAREPGTTAVLGPEWKSFPADLLLQKVFPRVADVETRVAFRCPGRLEPSECWEELDACLLAGLDGRRTHAFRRPWMYASNVGSSYDLTSFATPGFGQGRRKRYSLVIYQPGRPSNGQTPDDGQTSIEQTYRSLDLVDEWHHQSRVLWVEPL